MKNYNDIKIYVNDNGNESIKSMNENFEKIHFLNVVSQVTNQEAEGHIAEEERFGGSKQSIYDSLDVTITKDNKVLGRYYIGNLAIERFKSKAGRRNASMNKAKDEQTYICSYVATALDILASDPEKLHINAGHIMQGAMLPMKEFRSDEFYKEMLENLSGNIKIEFNRGVLKGKVVEYIAEQEDTFVYPEGGIGINGLYYNDDGSYNEAFAQKVKDRYIIGFDIGSISTDMAAMINESPYPALCKHVGEGITQPLFEIKKSVEDYIIREFKKEVVISTDELNVVIRDRDYKYPLGQKDIDIKDFVNTVLNRNVKSILNEFDSSIDISMNNKIYGLVNFGGGAILMDKLIQDRLSGRFDFINVVDNKEDLLWFNTKSAVKVIKSERLNKVS